MLAGAIYGDPEQRLKQQAQEDSFMLEQDRTDAYLRNIDAGIADQNAKLDLQRGLTASQQDNYAASSKQSLASALNSERDAALKARQLEAYNNLGSKIQSAYAPRPVPAVNSPINPAAAGPTQAPATTRGPTEQEMFAGLGDALAPIIIGNGGNPAGVGDFLRATTALGANAGIIPPDQQEAKLRNALIGAGQMPDLNTALTTDRQNEVINLNATNDQALEKVKPASLTTSSLQAGVWNKILNDPNYTPTSQEQALLNSGSKTSNISVDPETGAVSITESSGSGLASSTQGQIEKRAQAIQDFENTIDQISTLAADPTNFGLTGILKGTYQDVVQQGGALSQYLAGAPIGQDIQTKEGTSLAADFDPNLPVLRLLANTLAYQYATAIAGNDRISDADFRQAQQAVGDPSAWNATAAGFKAKAGVLKQMARQKRANMAGILDAGDITPALTEPAGLGFELQQPAAAGAGQVIDFNSLPD